MTQVYRMADTGIKITSLYDVIHRMCGDYISESDPDFAVEITEDDIASERGRSEGAELSGYSDAYIETLAVCRGISEKMPYFGAFLFHGSAIAVDGEAYIFTAASGVGKSTHARLWREYLGGRAFMVNDDKPFIRPGEEPLVYGSPWDGKHKLSRNVSVPVKAIALLRRSEKNSVEPISYREAFPALLRQAYRPSDPEALSKTLSLLDKLNVRFYSLCCNMEPEAAAVSYNGMKG